MTEAAHNRPSCALWPSLESDMSETKIDERGASGEAPPWVVATKNPAGAHFWLGHDGLWTSDFSRVLAFNALGGACLMASAVKVGFVVTLAEAQAIQERR